MNFTSIGGEFVEGYCLIKTADVKTTAKGMKYLDLMVADSSGEINAKYWNLTDKEQDLYKSGDVVKIRGSIAPYNNVDQLKIDRIRHTTAEDNIDVNDFVPSAEYKPEDMYNELLKIANGFEDQDLKKLVTTIYERNREVMLYVPAAFKLHHAIRGGLLYHMLSIVRLCEKVSEVYPFIDRELLISGAMLHDIAKIAEFSLNSTGLVEEYSTKGNLLGHIPMGAMIVDNIAKELGINEETAMLIEHMILSHHGNPEFGAAVRPMFLEAELLSELDLMDSRVYEILSATKDLEKGKFSSRQWALDNVKLYNHKRKSGFDGAKLF